MEQDAESGGSGTVQEAYRRTIASVRYMGKHPGGVVISDPRDYWMFPTMLSHGNRVSAFDKLSTERLGGLKVDLLGLQTVAVLSRLEKTTGNRPDETCSDRKVWDFICEGDLDGCFQFEERTAKEIVVSIQPRTIEDLAVCTSVNRPGPLELGYPEKYVELKGAKVEGWREYFEDTRGLPLYQDQIWVFLQEVARFKPDDADKVMKIMKGGNVHAEARVQSLLKRRKELEAKFIENVRGEYSPRQAKEMWDAIIQYAFNKAHAVAYATVGYQTAWYKCYYPLEFAHSLLVQRPKYPDCAKALQIAWRSGVVVMPPHVNASMGFTVEEDAEGRRFIRRGYSSVKGVGPSAAQKIKHGAPYSDWSDFDERSGVPSNAVQSLEEAGALYWPGRDDDKIAAAERAFREQTMRLKVSRKKVKTYQGT
jgi:DNA polymerase III alpha subunit